MNNTDKQAAQKELDEIKARAAALEKIINAPDVPELPDNGCTFVPGYEERYFGCTADCCVETFVWDNDAFDKGCLEQGNVFRTKEGAEKARERRKVIAELWKCDGVFLPDWGNGEWDKFYIHYEHADGLFDVDNSRQSQFNLTLPCFRTFDQAEAAIDKIGQERLKVLLD